jgi:hypothetical protein
LVPELEILGQMKIMKVYRATGVMAELLADFITA